MEGERLEITKLLAATPSRVFQAWTDPQIVGRWFGPGAFTAAATEPDARPGGNRIEMSDPEGAKYTAVGVYREVEKDARLVFSFSWEGSDGPETQVTVTLRPQRDKTELVLVHEGFPTAEIRDRHVHGWSGSTAKLEELLTAG